MRSSSINSWMAAQRSHSLTRRWTSGRGLRRRSGRGGKCGPRPPAPFAVLPLAPFQPDQKTVAQHHRDRMPMKAIPAPPLILIPAQFRFGFLMILLHPVAAVGILHQHGQGRVCREVTPEIFPIPGLASSGALPNQPADVAGGLAHDPPPAQGGKNGPPPALGPRPPPDAFAVPGRLRRPHLLGPPPPALPPPSPRH